VKFVCKEVRDNVLSEVGNYKQDFTLLNREDYNLNYLTISRFEFLTVVLMKIQVFLDVGLLRLVNSYRC
jgi:hypothetical protein